MCHNRLWDGDNLSSGDTEAVAGFLLRGLVTIFKLWELLRPIEVKTYSKLLEANSQQTLYTSIIKKGKVTNIFINESIYIHSSSPFSLEITTFIQLLKLKMIATLRTWQTQSRNFQNRRVIFSTQAWQKSSRLQGQRQCYLRMAPSN